MFCFFKNSNFPSVEQLGGFDAGTHMTGGHLWRLTQKIKVFSSCAHGAVCLCEWNEITDLFLFLIELFPLQKGGSVRNNLTRFVNEWNGCFCGSVVHFPSRFEMRHHVWRRIQDVVNSKFHGVCDWIKTTNVRLLKNAERGAAPAL